MRARCGRCCASSWSLSGSTTSRRRRWSVGSCRPLRGSQRTRPSRRCDAPTFGPSSSAHHRTRSGTLMHAQKGTYGVGDILFCTALGRRRSSTSCASTSTSTTSTSRCGATRPASRWLQVRMVYSTARVVLRVPFCMATCHGVCSGATRSASPPRSPRESSTPSTGASPICRQRRSAAVALAEWGNPRDSAERDRLCAFSARGCEVARAQCYGKRDGRHLPR